MAEKQQNNSLWAEIPDTASQGNFDAIWLGIHQSDEVWPSNLSTKVTGISSLITINADSPK